MTNKATMDMCTWPSLSKIVLGMTLPMIDSSIVEAYHWLSASNLFVVVQLLLGTSLDESCMSVAHISSASVAPCRGAVPVFMTI